MAGNANEPGRSTTSRVGAVLGAFSLAYPVLSVTEVARRAGIPKSSTHRLLHELMEWGAIEQQADGRYAIGLQAWKIGRLARSPKLLIDVARPVMEDLHRVNLETVQLTILDQNSALLVERVHGSESVPTFAEVGTRMPLHASASGKALAAHSSEAEQLVLGTAQRAITPQTVTDPTQLRAMYARVRSQGIAYSIEELVIGTFAVACPIIDSSGRLRAALSLAFRSTRSTPYRFASTIRAAAYGIGRNLPLLFDE